MADVFISYARQDRVVAKRLADALAAFGWEAWWDPSLLPGTRFRAEITRQLHDANCVVVLWSRSSVESDWVIDEAEDAKARGVLVQARIEDVKLPHGFRQIQSGNLIGWEGALDAAPLLELRGGIERLIQLSDRSLAEHNYLAVADGSMGKSVATRLRFPAINSKVLTGFAASVVLVAALFGASRLWWSEPPPAQVESSEQPCTFAFAPGTAAIGSKGGEASVRVITSAACDWSASARSGWIFVSGEGRTGSAEVTYVVTANDTPRAREGVLEVQGQSFRISQDAGPLRSRVPGEPSPRQAAPVSARSGGEPTKPAPTPARSGGEPTKLPLEKDSPIQPSTEPQPKKTKHVAPIYPEEAQGAGLQGNVKIDIVIGPDGKVQDARVVSPPQRLLDQAALDAAKQWEYEPTIIDNVRVPVTISSIVRFVLTSPDRREPSRLVRVGGDIKAPTRTRYVPPVYPPLAVSARVEGEVIIEITIGADGEVKDARVLRSIPQLDQAAIDAVRQWEYTPTVIKEVPTPVIMTVTVRFSLK